VSAPQPHGSCERGDDAPAYVLGALEDPDAFRSHLAGCSACRAEVTQLHQAADLLADAVARTAAPQSMRERILAVVRSEADLLHAAGASSDLPHRARSGIFGRRGAAIAGAVAAAAAAFVVGLAVQSGTTERVSRGAVSRAFAGASVSLRQTGGHAELNVSSFPQAPFGKVYEVWLRRAAGPPQPTDALFGVTTRGRGAVAVPGGLKGIREVLITSEPAGGSLQPTSAPFARVVLSA
jgi:Anti-sigma-K factor rskA, C-terminal